MAYNIKRHVVRGHKFGFALNTDIACRMIVVLSFSPLKYVLDCSPDFEAKDRIKNENSGHVQPINID